MTVDLKSQLEGDETRLDLSNRHRFEVGVHDVVARTHVAKEQVDADVDVRDICEQVLRIMS